MWGAPSPADAYAMQLVAPRSLASTARSPDYAPQHLIVLDKVVTQRGNDMDEHDRGKHIGENHMRLLDPLPHRPIHRGNQWRHVDPEQVFGHGNAERRRDHPTRERDGEHQDVETGVREARGNVLPAPEIGGKFRPRVEPS